MKLDLIRGVLRGTRKAHAAGAGARIEGPLDLVGRDARHGTHARKASGLARLLRRLIRVEIGQTGVDWSPLSCSSALQGGSRAGSHSAPGSEGRPIEARPSAPVPSLLLAASARSRHNDMTQTLVAVIAWQNRCASQEVASHFLGRSRHIDPSGDAQRRQPAGRSCEVEMWYKPRSIARNDNIAFLLIGTRFR